jgi:hypothetical protein
LGVDSWIFADFGSMICKHQRSGRLNTKKFLILCGIEGPEVFQNGVNGKF